MKVTCKACGEENSYCASPTEYEGYFLTDAIIDNLGIKGHQEFNTMMDFTAYLREVECEYVYKCKHCGVIWNPPAYIEE